VLQGGGTTGQENSGMAIIEARQEDMHLIRELFQEYEEFLGFDLCFQDFQQELASLPGAYGPPSGTLLLAREGEGVLGCVALRAIEPDVCEMKRLYLRPAARGKGTGLALCRDVIDRARKLGYKSMKLDTVSKLSKAIDLYRTLGFKTCPAYCHNPHPDVEYFELQL
jgi:GNAT superfamily N-acetyltransferase